MSKFRRANPFPSDGLEYPALDKGAAAAIVIVSIATKMQRMHHDGLCMFFVLLGLSSLLFKPHRPESCVVLAVLMV